MIDLIAVCGPISYKQRINQVLRVSPKLVSRNTIKLYIQKRFYILFEKNAIANCHFVVKIAVYNMID